MNDGDLVMRKDGEAFHVWQDNSACYMLAFEEWKLPLKSAAMISTNYGKKEDLCPAPPKPDKVEGFEVTGEFRPAKDGEWYYAQTNVEGTTWAANMWCDGNTCEPMPRWILRPCKPHVEGYEVVGFRPPKNDDEMYFHSEFGVTSIRAAFPPENSACPQTIAGINRDRRTPHWILRPCPNCSNPTKEHKAEVDMGMKCIKCGKDMRRYAERKMYSVSEKTDPMVQICTKKDAEQKQSHLDHCIHSFEKAYSNLLQAVNEMQ